MSIVSKRGLPERTVSTPTEWDTRKGKGTREEMAVNNGKHCTKDHREAGSVDFRSRSRPRSPVIRIGEHARRALSGSGSRSMLSHRRKRQSRKKRLIQRPHLAPACLRQPSRGQCIRTRQHWGKAPDTDTYEIGVFAIILDPFGDLAFVRQGAVP